MAKFHQRRHNPSKMMLRQTHTTQRRERRTQTARMRSEAAIRGLVIQTAHEQQQFQLVARLLRSSVAALGMYRHY